MNRRILSVTLIAACAAIVFPACETEEPPGGRPGSTKWHWMNAVEYYSRSQLNKMVDEIQVVVERDDEYKDNAIMWRTAVLYGLGQGLMEIGDAYRSAIEEKEELAADYQNPVQQANRDARQYAIQFAETFGDVKRLLENEKVVLEFPFPPGEHAPSPIVEKLADALPVKSEEAGTALIHELKRAMILASAKLAGEEDIAQARTKFEAGPIEVDSTEATFTIASMLLDTGLLFSKSRIFDPKIRNILIDQAEGLIQPFEESEDADLKERAEEFAKEVEDERRDIDGKARRVKARE